MRAGLQPQRLHSDVTAQCSNILRVSLRPALESRGACDENGCTCSNGARRCLEIDAAIHFKLDIKPFLIDPLADDLDALQLAFNEALSAKAGVHGHDKHEIDIAKKRPEKFERRARVKREARLAARGLDCLNGAMGM